MYYQSLDYKTEDTVLIIITYGFAALRIIPSINSINQSFLELRYATQPINELYDLLSLKELKTNKFKLIKNEKLVNSRLWLTKFNALDKSKLAIFSSDG